MAGKSNSLSLSYARRWAASNWRLIVGSALLFTVGAMAVRYYNPAEYRSETRVHPRFVDPNVFTNDKSGFSVDVYAKGLSLENAAALMRSRVFTERIVKELRLQDGYYKPLPLWNEADLYGHSPISVGGIGEDDKRHVAFSVELGADRKTASLSRFSVDGEPLEATVAATLGKPVATPVGTVTVYPTKFLADYGGSRVDYRFTPAGEVAAGISSKLSSVQIAMFTDVLSCVYQDRSRQRADDVLNAIPYVYDQVWRQWNADDSRKIDETIRLRLSAHADSLAEIESRISAILEANNSTGASAEARRTASERTAMQRRVVHLAIQSRIADEIKRQVGADAQSRQLVSASVGALDSRQLRSLVTDYNKLLLDRQKAASTGGEGNPAVAIIDSQIQLSQSAIASSVDSYTASLDVEKRQAAARLDSIGKKIESLASQERALRQLERNQTFSQDSYLTLLSKQQSQLGDLNSYFVPLRVIQPATCGDTPLPMPLSHLLAIAFFFGAIVVPAIMLLVSYALDTTIHGKDDFAALPIPIAGELPQLTKVPLLTQARVKLRLGYKDSPTHIPSIVVADPQAGDAFRLLRSNLEFIDSQSRGPRVAIATSATPGSGKTFIALNLAAAVALSGKRTLAVDLDIRRSTLSKYVGSPRKGAVSFLNDERTDIDSLIVADKSVAGLSILPCGTIPPNPAELLERDSLDRLFEQLRSRFDYIIVDCAPLELVADTALIARVATSTLFVARVGLLDRRFLPTISRIAASGEYPSLRIVVNGVSK